MLTLLFHLREDSARIVTTTPDLQTIMPAPVDFASELTIDTSLADVQIALRGHVKIDNPHLSRIVRRSHRYPVLYPVSADRRP